MRIYTDGGSRGNPGPAAYGVYIEDDKGNVLCEIGQAIGVATNNVAEYKAVVAAFDWLLKNKNKIGEKEIINFYFDSLLIYSQIIGAYKIKNDVLRRILFSIREKQKQISQEIRYFHIPRELNKKADAQVNKALDIIGE